MSAKEDQKKTIEKTIRELSNDIPMHQWVISHHEKRIEASRRSIHHLKEQLAKLETKE